MPQLTDLPSELLMKIFDDLELRQISCVCQVSRRAKEVAQPYLYKKILLQGKRRLLLKRLRRFTRTVLCRSDLAAKAKIIAIYLKVSDKDLDMHKGVEELQLLQNAMSDTDEDAILNTMSPAQALQLLSTRLPALESLTFNIESRLRGPVFDLFQGVCSDNLSPAFFPALKVLVLKGYDVSFRLNDTLRLLTLPSLQRVVAHMCFADGDHGEDSLALKHDDIIAASSVKLTQCSLDVQAFQDLIKACHTLKFLEYESALGAMSHEEEYLVRRRIHLTPQDFFQVLSPCSKTLERLSYKPMPPDYRDDYGDIFIEFPGLKPFHQLKYLSVQIALWYKLCDKLPDSLVAIVLSSSPDRSRPDRELFQDLFNAKKLYAPGLKILRIGRDAVDAAKIIKEHARQQYDRGFIIRHKFGDGSTQDAVELPIDSAFVIELTHGDISPLLPIHSRIMKTAMARNGDLQHETTCGFDKAIKLPILHCTCQDAEDLLA